MRISMWWVVDTERVVYEFPLRKLWAARVMAWQHYGDVQLHINIFGNYRRIW